MPEDNPETTKEELYLVYRMLLYKMFIHVGDYSAIPGKVATSRCKIDSLLAESWIFRSHSEELFSFKWICDIFDLNIVTLRENIQKLKEDKIVRFGYQAFCSMLLNVRRGYIPCDSPLGIKGGGFSGMKVSLKKRASLYAESEGYKVVDDWIYEKIYSCGWGSKHFAVALETRYDNIVRYIEKEYGLKINDEGVV